MKTEVKVMKIKDIALADNSRFKASNVAELMASIKAKGLLQPVGVVKIKGKYRLVFGNGYANLHERNLMWQDIIHTLTDKNKVIPRKPYSAMADF